MQPDFQQNQSDVNNVTVIAMLIKFAQFSIVRALFDFSLRMFDHSITSSFTIDELPKCSWRLHLSFVDLHMQLSREES